VTVLRAWGAAEPRPVSRAPHAEQNAASSGAARPHLAQVGMGRVYVRPDRARAFVRGHPPPVPWARARGDAAGRPAPLYRAFGLEEVERFTVTMSDGVTVPAIAMRTARRGGVRAAPTRRRGPVGRGGGRCGAEPARRPARAELCGRQSRALLRVGREACDAPRARRRTRRPRRWCSRGAAEAGWRAASAARTDATDRRRRPAPDRRRGRAALRWPVTIPGTNVATRW